MAGARQPRKKKAAPSAADELRRQAEERLDKLSADAADAASPVPEGVAAVVHALRVHQIELEMQNEELRRAQLELQASREKYIELFDLAPVGYLILSDESIVRDANLTAARLLGVERQQLVGRPFTAFIFAPDQDMYYRQQRMLEQTGEPQTCELRLRRAGDADAEAPLGHFWARLEGRPQRAADGETLSFWVTFTDIDAEVAAQEALRESEARYRDVVERASDGIGILQGDVLVLANEALAKMSGYTADELADMPFLAVVSPAQHEAIANRVRRRLAGEQPPTGYEIDLVRKDGTPFTAEVSAGVITYEGAPADLVLMRDITERKQAEERLAAAAGQWRQTFDAMSDSVALFDREGRVLRCNVATTALTGRSVDDILGRRCFEVFHGATAFHRDCPQLRALDSGRTETSAMEQDGHWLRFTFQPLTDEGGRVSGGVHVITDVSELKHAEQGLLESLVTQQTITEGVIAALARTVEVRDPYTAGHQRRVSQLGAAMALHMGLGEERAEGVRVAGMLHDVGKITIPAEILSKPGRLTTMEFELIKGHAQAGFEILQTIHFPWLVAAMTLQHHERQDGSGYPAGLRGDEILPEARILAVADVVEAMASHRPYRAALGVAAALEEVHAGAGTRYEAFAVAACERVFAQGFVFTES